jgi:hypothetical protein
VSSIQPARSLFYSLVIALAVPAPALAQRGAGGGSTGINRIEIMRMQVEDLRTQHGSNAALDRALEGIYKHMYDTELHYLSRTEMHSDDKWYVEKYKLYLNLVWLLAEIGGSGGDVMGGVGYRPTNAAVAVFKERLAEIEAARKDFDRLMKDVDAFNKAHAGKLAPITDRLTTRP